MSYHLTIQIAWLRRQTIMRLVDKPLLLKLQDWTNNVLRAFKFLRFKIDWNYDFVGLLHHPFWLKLVSALWGITFHRSRRTLFCQGTLRFENTYTEDDIINMLVFLVDNIFVVFGGKVFQQLVGIPMGTNCALLLADIFLYSYEAEYIQCLL